MQLERHSYAADFSDRFYTGAQAVVGKLINIPPNLLTKALLTDGWAIELQYNNGTQQRLDEHIRKLEPSYAERNVFFHRTEQGTWLMFGDIEKLVSAVNFEVVQKPVDDYESLIELLQEKRELARQTSQSRKV